MKWYPQKDSKPKAKKYTSMVLVFKRSCVEPPGDEHYHGFVWSYVAMNIIMDLMWSYVAMNITMDLCGAMWP